MSITLSNKHMLLHETFAITRTQIMLCRSPIALNLTLKLPSLSLSSAFVGECVK